MCTELGVHIYTYIYIHITSMTTVTQQKNRFNSLTTNDDYSRHRNSVTCYQLAQSVLKIGSALAKRVGQGEVGRGEVSMAHSSAFLFAVADLAWRLLQLALEKARSALDGPLFCFLVQTGVENCPFTL